MSLPLLSPDGAAGGNAPAWLATIPEELRGEASLHQVPDVPTLAKNYVNAQRLIGVDKIPAPKKDWGETQWNEFYERLGRPKTPDQYPGLPEDFKLEEGLKVDEKAMAAAKALFHKAGLTPTQAQSVLRHYFESMNESTRGAKAARQAQVEATMNQLSSKYGDKAKAMIDIANAAVTRLGGEEFSKFLADSGLGNDPRMIETFITVGKMLMEDQSIGKGTGLQVQDETAAKAEIEKLTLDKEFMAAWSDRTNPGHQAALDRWMALHKIAYPGKQAT